jgi:hypothetical protein
MKKRFVLGPGAALTAISFLTATAQGQTLFSNAMDSADGWAVNLSHTSSTATFGFDYSALGIPPSPNGGGSTLGLRLEANVPGGAAVFQGVSVSPTGGAFNGDFQLRFDLWQNFPGNYPGGGTGSTQLTGAGIGTSGTSAMWPGNANGVLFMATGDGALTTGDYRIYPAGALATPSSGMYAAGTTTSPDVRDSAHPYYASFGGVTGPAAQGYTGTTGVGSQGMEWHDVAITRVGNTVTWEIDGILIGTVNAGALTLSGDNFALVQSDINGGTTTVAERPHLFGLVDNVRVTVVPEPTSAALMAVAGAFFLARRRKN